MDIIDQKLIEDRIYKIGEISQATGLQKTANGWVKPKSGKAPGAKTGPGENAKNPEWGEKVIKKTKEEQKSFSSIPTEKLEKMQEVFKKHNSPTLKKVEEELAKRNGRSESKPAESKPAAASKHDTDPLTYIPKKNDELRVMFQKEKDPAKKAAMKKALQKQASMKPREPWSPGEETESKPKAPKPSFNAYMDARRKAQNIEKVYKQQMEEYEIAQRLKAGGLNLDPTYGMKPKELDKNDDYIKAKEIMNAYEAEDAAPKCLTGDCKIRVKKEK